LHVTLLIFGEFHEKKKGAEKALLQRYHLPDRNSRDMRGIWNISLYLKCYINLFFCMGVNLGRWH
jgi:hypothetical protein